MGYIECSSGGGAKRKDAFFMEKNGLSASYVNMPILDYNDDLFSVSGDELTAKKNVDLTIMFSIVNARLNFYVDNVSVYSYNAGTVTNTVITRTYSISQGSKIKITAMYENGAHVGFGAGAYAIIN